MILTTRSESWTGKILYSDAYAEIPANDYDALDPSNDERPVLNQLAAVPILGYLAAVARIALSLIHIMGHTFAACVFRDRGHFCHVAKGGAELLRGIVEILPVFGRIFSWAYDAKQPSCHRCDAQGVKKISCFLIKIRNPDKLDKIDHVLNSRQSSIKSQTPG
jgi:hypothetical protein